MNIAPFQRSGSYFRYESRKMTKYYRNRMLSLSGENTSYSFVPRSPGNYELRISLPGATAYVSKNFTATDHGVAK